MKSRNGKAIIFYKRVGGDNDKLIAICLGVPVEKDNFIGIWLVDFSKVPEKFYSVYADEADYIFYEDKFAMVFSSISNYGEVYKHLSGKYSAVATISKKVTSVKRLKDPDNVTAILFKKGGEKVCLKSMPYKNRRNGEVLRQDFYVRLYPPGTRQLL